MEKPKPYFEERPWGSFTRFTLNEVSTVKILSVTQGHKNSLQSHANRQEFWKVLSGSPVVTVGSLTEIAKVGNEYWIPEGTAHRIGGGETGAEVLEVSFGTFNEEDITRFEDDFGRV